MPTYEYECTKCNKEFEVSQSMKDDAFKICPKELCRMKTKWGKGAVKRKLGAGAGFIFKGSGFYITDYRSEGYKKDKTASTATATPSDSSSKSETKTEKPKTETKAKPTAKPEV